MAGIRITNSQGVRLRGNFISGFDVGVEINNSSVVAEQNTFENVEVKFKISDSEARVSKSRSRAENKREISNHAEKKTHGWRADRQPAMPVHCAKCDSIFPSSKYTIWNSKFYGSDNTETCPLCGSQDARLADGIFEALEETIRLLAGPETTIDTFERLKKISAQAISGSITIAQAKEGIIKEVPVTASLIEKITKFGKDHAFTILLAAYAMTADADDVIENLRKAFNYFYTQEGGPEVEPDRQLRDNPGLPNQEKSAACI